jgi:hypothetical protein
MKKTKSIFLTLSFILFATSGCLSVMEEDDLVYCDATHSPFGGGSGSISDPYLICSVTQLKQVSASLSSHYRLSRNLNLTGISFSPIGSNSIGFSGTFDGNNLAISGWTYAATSGSEPVAFIRRLEAGGIIKNLTLSSISVTGEDSNDLVAGFVGVSEGSVDHVYLKNSTISGKSTVGGIIAEAKSNADLDSAFVIGSTISSSAIGASMRIATDTNAVGGLVAIWKKDTTGSEEITASSVSDSVIVFDKDSAYQNRDARFVGGLIGYFNQGSLLNSTFAGTSVQGKFNVGGLVGFSSSTVTECSASGTVQGVSRVGGAFGFLGSTAIRISASGIVIAEIDASADGQVGGLVGLLTGTISNSFFSGSINADETVGGIAGLVSSGTVTNSYAFGTVTGNADPIGGAFGDLIDAVVSQVYVYQTSVSGGSSQAFVGQKSGSTVLSQCYFNQMSNSSSNGGTSISTPTDLSQYTGFSDTNWRSPSIYAGRSALTPVLAWECNQNGVTCSTK